MDYLEQVLLNTHRIDPNLYEEYDVKRGLRDSNGKGVLTGLTEVSDVCGFDVINGRKIPAEGSLYYQGINVNDLVHGLGSKKFGFEEGELIEEFGYPNQRFVLHTDKSADNVIIGAKVTVTVDRPLGR